MCGLVGCAGFLGSQEREAFRNLLLEDYVRGKDSTGIALVSGADWGSYVVKELGHPVHLFESYNTFDDDDYIIKGTHWRLLMGHNRAATRGKTSVDNAHPFEHGDWIGAHNGTLNTVNGLDKGYSFDVDSEAIIHDLSINGIEATLKKVNGAYALSLYNKVEHKLYLTRNSERPLYYAVNEANTAVFWSSDQNILAIACHYAHVKLQKIEPVPVLHVLSLNIEPGNITKDKSFEDMGEYKDYKSTPFRYASGSSYNRDALTGNVADSSNFADFLKKQAPPIRGSRGIRNDTDGIMMALQKKYEGKEVDFVFVHEASIGNVKYIEGAAFTPEDSGDTEGFEIRIFSSKFYDQIKTQNGTWRGKVKKFIFMHDMWHDKDVIYALMDNRTIAKGSATFASIEKKDDTIPFSKSVVTGKFIGYRGEALTEEEWEKATRNKCANCMQDADPKHPNSIHWIEPDEFLCRHCATSEEVLYFFGDLTKAGGLQRGSVN